MPADVCFAGPRAVLVWDGSEAGMRARHGRLSVLETSGRPQYESTRGFYLKLGYTEAARLREFYDIADDKVVYLKAL